MMVQEFEADEGWNVELDSCTTHITAKELAVAEFAVLIQPEEHADTIFNRCIHGYCL
jgi:hypothetical protein